MCDYKYMLTNKIDNIYNVISSFIFKCTCWLYSYNEASVHGHEIFKTSLAKLVS
jgi:hypothetical protein